MNKEALKKKMSKVITALVTPFKDQVVDYKSFENLLQQQLDSGIKDFVINGTTAESPTLTNQEVENLFDHAKKKVLDSGSIILGTGSNSTLATTKNTQRAAELGADAALVVVPYYNKPTQEGLYLHFKTIADSCDIPIILYNVPGRTITSLGLETIKKLSEHPRIIGIKEASGDIAFAKQIRETCGDQFLLLSGDDATYEQFLFSGGDGIISVASHIVPKAFLEKNIQDYQRLITILFQEPNPTPVKMALYIQKIIQSPECRLPLLKMTALGAEVLTKEMSRLNLIPGN